MPLTQEVTERLFVAKNLLNRIQFLPNARPDRITLAQHILTAHDAAELALAAIAQHLGKLPEPSESFLMKYFPAIKQIHPEREVSGRTYFSQLNQIRVNIKHLGIFPDPKDWYRVGEKTWDYVSQWCREYLSLSLDDLDESSLITDASAKEHYGAAIKGFDNKDFKKTLEHLAFATKSVFESNLALRNLRVGDASAIDAIKLAAFGVHANDYLALQQFLPQIVDVNGDFVVKWNQEKYGHPANWTQQTAEFCLQTFVHLALRIQDAEWIPGPIDFWSIYQHKITALTDGVEIFQIRGERGLMGTFKGKTERVVVRTLNKNESVRALVLSSDEKIIRLAFYRQDDESVWGDVEADKVKITCCPREDPFIKQFFPYLTEIPFEPEKK